ncbi:hypothetical protein SLA2020_010300 [Shorea laevis]
MQKLFLTAHSRQTTSPKQTKPLTKPRPSQRNTKQRKQQSNLFWNWMKIWWTQAGLQTVPQVTFTAQVSYLASNKDYGKMGSHSSQSHQWVAARC